MGVRGTDRGAAPIAKSVEFSKVPGREGLHLLGQSLRFFFPLFAALFGFGPLTRSGRVKFVTYIIPPRIRAYSKPGM